MQRKAVDLRLSSTSQPLILDQACWYLNESSLHIKGIWICKHSIDSGKPWSHGVDIISASFSWYNFSTGCRYNHSQIYQFNWTPSILICSTTYTLYCLLYCFKLGNTLCGHECFGELNNLNKYSKLWLKIF